MADYEKMTKDELQEELEDRDLAVSGNKDELVARLELDDAEREEQSADDGTDEDSDDSTDDSTDDSNETLDEPEPATPEEIAEAQVKDESGQRDPEENPEPDTAAGPEDEADEITEDSFQTSGGIERDDDEEGPGTRRRIDETFDEPEPREVGRTRVPGEFDYELLPDGRKRKLIFEDEDDDQE